MCKLGIVHAAGHDDRDFGSGIFEALHVGHVHAFFLIHRRVVPEPRIVRALVDVEGFVAVGVQKLRRFHAFLKVATLFLKFFAGQRAIVEVLDHRAH